MSEPIPVEFLTPGEAPLELVGPVLKGAKGDKGDKGDTGDTGIGVPSGGVDGQLVGRVAGTPAWVAAPTLASLGAEAAGTASTAVAAHVAAADPHPLYSTAAKVSSAIAAAASAYAPAAQGVTGGNSHNHNGGDGAQIAYSSLSGAPVLGNSAGLNVGTTAGTVAAGNDSRFHSSVTLGASLTPVLGVTGQQLNVSNAPTADRIVFYDQSASAMGYLTLGDNLSISGTTINASGGISLALAAGLAIAIG